MINGYFDMSEDHPDGVTAVAGYVGDVEEWESVKRQWEEVLASPHLGMSSFRLSTVRSAYGANWPEVTEPFAEILGKSALKFVGAAIDRGDWRQQKKDTLYLKTYPRPPHACLDYLLEILAEECSLTFRGLPIAITFDPDFETKARAERVYRAWRERTSYPAFSTRTFLDAEEKKKGPLRPLECADLAAGLMRQDRLTRAFLDSGKPTSAAFLEPDDPMDRADLRQAICGRFALWSVSVAERVEEALKDLRSRGELPEPAA